MYNFDANVNYFFFQLFTTHSFTNYNPGICPHCGNHFNRLKQHIIYKHTTEKPFKCQKCDFAHALPKGKVSILGVESLGNLRGNCRYVEFLFGSQEPEKIGHHLWMFPLVNSYIKRSSTSRYTRY